MRLSAFSHSFALLAGVAFTLSLPAGSCAAGPPAKERLDPYGDSLPVGAIMRLGTQRWRHRDGFHDPVFSPDGRWVLAMSKFGPDDDVPSLNIWDWSTGRLVRTVERTTFPSQWRYYSYAFLEDSKHLLIQGSDEMLLCDFPSFQVGKRWKVGYWRSLVVSPDGRFAAGTTGKGIKPQQTHALHLETSNVRPIWKTDSGYIEALALTGDGYLVVVHATVDKRLGDLSEKPFFILRIDLLTGRVCGKFKIEADDIVLAPGGRHLVASSWGRGLRLYRVDTGKMRRLPLTAGAHMAYGVIFRPDSRVLVTVDFPLPKYGPDGSEEPVDHGPRLAWTWDVERGALLDRVRVPDRHSDRSPSWPILSPDGRALLLFSTDAATRVSMRTGKLMDERAAFNELINSLRWSANGREIDGETWFEEQVRWNSATGRLLGRDARRDFTTVQHQGLRAQSPDGQWEAAGVRILHQTLRRPRREGETQAGWGRTGSDRARV